MNDQQGVYGNMGLFVLAMHFLFNIQPDGLLLANPQY